MNKKKQIEILKEELSSLESIVINFHRNASSTHINYANQPKIFSSSSYFKPVETSRKTMTINTKYNFNQIDPHVRYKVLPNNPRHNKFTFIAKKSDNVLINKNVKAGSSPQFSKCFGTEAKANYYDSKVSLSATEINSSCNPSNKTTNQITKDLDLFKQSNFTVPSRSFLNTQNILKSSSETTQRISNTSSIKPCYPSSAKTSLDLAKTNSIKLGGCSVPNTVIKHEVNIDFPHAVKLDTCQISFSVKTPQKDKIFAPPVQSSKILSKDFPETGNFIPLSTNVRDIKNQFKLVNRNTNLPTKLKTFVNSPELNFPLKKPLTPKTKSLLLNKYSIKNANKNITTLDSRPSMIFSQSISFPSKYKIVNQHVPKNSKICDIKQDIVKNEKTNSADMTISNKNSSNETKSEIKKQALRQKINRLKFKRSNRELDILTDFSPDELVAMDTGSLLKLSALIKSSNKRQDTLLEKSKYKLVCKRPSLLYKAAKMIKTKYKVKVKSPKCEIYMSSSSKGHHDKWKSPWLRKGHKQYVHGVQDKSLKLKNSRYKSTNPMVLTHRYPAYKMKLTRASKRSLIFQSGKFSLKKGYGTNAFESATKNYASRVLHKSKQTASAAQRKKLKKSNTYCMFFNRFGKCNRGTSCTFIHDPSKIAVCSKFLRGTCKTKNCPFSHEKAPGKMAICSFFLQGLCTKNDCPYRHEQLNPDAKLCKKFVQGYCSLGTKCEKAHVLICPDHFKGECEKGNSCAYPHPPKKERKNCSSQPKNTGNYDKEASKAVQLKENDVEDSESEDEAGRYFNIEPKSESKGKTASAESDQSKSISCRPQRSKIVDCPSFIPL